MHIQSMTLPEVTAVLKELGQPAFRGKQVYTWLHKGVGSYDEMTNLSKGLREQLAEKYPIYTPKVVRKQESKKDGTIKYLWQLADGNCVETVLMRYHYGNTVCISTEVGCRMGCAFCASTLGGLVRKLEPFEMLDQVLFTQLDSGLPVSHIVLMGIGEPLDNLPNVLRFLELVNSPEGMNISMRHISLSTCGVIPGIERLADMGIARFLIASAVRAIMAQRLCRSLCSCKIDGQLTEKQASTLGMDISRGVKIPRPGGCDKCRGKGMKGRMGIFEIFQVTDDVRGLINSDLTSAQLRKRARELGMRTLREDGIRKVLAGLTSAEEIIRVTTGDAS